MKFEKTHIYLVPRLDNFNFDVTLLKIMFSAFETDEDMDAFEIEVTSKCLNQSGHNPPDNLTYETVRDYIFGK